MRTSAATLPDVARVVPFLAGLNLPTAGLADHFPGGYAIATREGEMLVCAGFEV